MKFTVKTDGIKFWKVVDKMRLPGYPLTITFESVEKKTAAIYLTI